MKTTPLTRSRSEERTYRLLASGLESRDYRIQSAVRLQDAIALESSDALDSYEEIRYFRQAHFDFVVCESNQGHPLVPVFAVEFDGSQHEDDPDQRRRDVLKNRFCKDAELPLLRITSEQIESQERISILEYMIELFIGWRKEGPSFQRDCQERLNEWIQEDPERAYRELDENGLDPSFDANLLFALEHPYPATKTVDLRLARMGVFTAKGRAARVTGPGTPFLYLEDMQTGMGSMDPRPDRWAASHVAFLCRETFPQRSLRLTAATVEADPPEAVQILHRVERTTALKWGCETGRSIETRIGTLRDLMFADLPGVSIPHIAEQLARYLCHRDIETWLKDHRSGR